MKKISLTQVNKFYISDFRRKKKIAVEDVGFAIKAGESFGIIGANGAGKSTTLKMIMGFITPDSGVIAIDGKIPQDPSSRKNIGYLPENPYFYDNLSAEELLLFSSSASGMEKQAAKAQIKSLLTRVGLYDIRKARLRTYSKGMTQRAGICFSLVHDPDIVILDEPMSGLDPLGRKMVIDLIRELKSQGKTVLFCSHILNDVERICDRVAVMEAGRLLGVYSKQHIIDGGGMESLFLKVVGENAND